MMPVNIELRHVSIRRAPATSRFGWHTIHHLRTASHQGRFISLWRQGHAVPDAKRRGGIRAIVSPFPYPSCTRRKSNEGSSGCALVLSGGESGIVPSRSRVDSRPRPAHHLPAELALRLRPTGSARSGRTPRQRSPTERARGPPARGRRPIADARRGPANNARAGNYRSALEPRGRVPPRGLVGRRRALVVA